MRACEAPDKLCGRVHFEEDYGCKPNDEEYEVEAEVDPDSDSSFCFGELVDEK